MNKKQIIIDAPEGKVIDMEHFNETGNVRFIDGKPEKIDFPKEWELKTGINYFISVNSTISDWKIDDANINLNGHKNLLPTKSLAEQMLIFMQLITMRERYREIEKLNNPEFGEIDWENIQQYKYSIMLDHYELKIDVFLYLHNTFSFQLVETCDEFAKNFGDMILQCKDILG